MTPQRRGVVLLVILALATANPQPTSAGNILLNGGFDIPTPGLSPPNYQTSITGASARGVSSAEDWSLYNNFNATTSTELLPSTDPLGSGYMIHLTSVSNTSDPTGSFFNGLQQSFPMVPGGTASVDVDVLSGPVILALYAGNGSTLIAYTLSTATNQWETLMVTAPVGSNPNLVILYSYSTSGTGEFYADGAVAAATAAPEPSTWILALLGLLGVGFYNRGDLCAWLAPIGKNCLLAALIIRAPI